MNDSTVSEKRPLIDSVRKLYDARYYDAAWQGYIYYIASLKADISTANDDFPPFPGHSSFAETMALLPDKAISLYINDIKKLFQGSTLEKAKELYQISLDRLHVIDPEIYFPPFENILADYQAEEVAKLYPVLKNSEKISDVVRAKRLARVMIDDTLLYFSGTAELAEMCNYKITVEDLIEKARRYFLELVSPELNGDDLFREAMNLKKGLTG